MLVRTLCAVNFHFRVFYQYVLTHLLSLGVFVLTFFTSFYITIFWYSFCWVLWTTSFLRECIFYYLRAMAVAPNCENLNVWRCGSVKEWKVKVWKRDSVKEWNCESATERKCESVTHLGSTLRAMAVAPKVFPPTRPQCRPSNCANPENFIWFFYCEIFCSDIRAELVWTLRQVLSL